MSGEGGGGSSVRESSTIQQICNPIGESRGNCAHFLFQFASLPSFSMQFSRNEPQAVSAPCKVAIVLFGMFASRHVCMFACLHAEAIVKGSFLVVSSPFSSSNVSSKGKE